MRNAVKIIVDKINSLGGEKPLFIAVDGRCASGKTTLAGMLREEISCAVVHMDDFFLRPEQRTAERLNEPGGNVDRERFAAEVLLPLRAGKTAVFRPYCCRTGSFSEPVEIAPKPVVIAEGSYSCHPELWEFYDLHIFLTVNADEQISRVEKRCAEKLPEFREKWIPLEERYFEEFKIAARCEMRFDFS